ncbi:MAG TPA: SDR family oxidoreductase, partial [Bryobacteraceae bacterium]|nr:SDR family oxidoreductase [Bryobacteraceae bacterium]
RCFNGRAALIAAQPHRYRMDLQLAGKVALVTGSTAGIGYAAAFAMAQEGAEVIVNGRTTDRVEKAAQMILNSLPEATVHVLAADLGTAAGVDDAVRRFPQVDILVNNLGIFEPKPFEQITDADWMRFFEVNVLSGVRLSRHYLPKMREANWGRIIFVSSESALQIPAEMIHYGMTKTAQLAIARGIAETVAGTNITVNAVLPGPTASEGVNEFVDRLSTQQNASRQEFEKRFFEQMRPTSLLKRFETPEEIAACIAFVASPLASAINGASLRIDGGVVRSIA